MSAEPALTATAALRPFLRAVAHQVTYALGADPLENDAEVRASDSERRALALLRDAGALARTAVESAGSAAGAGAADGAGTDGAGTATEAGADTGVGAEADAAIDDVARRLLAEPAMLAAFFQNLDLLYEHGAPGADAVALVLMRAMEL